MKLVFSSDYHLGLNRVANTTAQSRIRLRDAISYQAKNVLSDDGTHICLGDLFDQYSNSESVIIDSLDIYNKLTLILSGNHDLINDQSKRGSLDLLMESMYEGHTRTVRASYNTGYHQTKIFKDTVIVSIPHHSSQDKFDIALQQAYEKDFSVIPTETKILLMHCNFDMPEVMTNDTALNLTKEDAEVLLEVYDYILLGHIHQPAEYFGGRLKIVGNIMPTGFSDISDKRVLIYDTDAKIMVSKNIWHKSEGYRQIRASCLLNGDAFPDLHTELQFVDVVGKVSPNQVRDLKLAIHKRIWAMGSEHLLAVRDQTEIIRPEGEFIESITGGPVVTLPEKVDSTLRDSDLYPLWKELLEICRRNEND